MEGLVLGIDLCDTYTQVSCYDKEQSWTIPTVICKKKNEDEWLVGEDAFGCALLGDGIIVDKLLNLVGKDGTATIEGVRYEGVQLLKQFIKKAIATAADELGIYDTAQLVISVPDLNVKLMDAFMYCADFLEISRDHIHVISHTESFIYYVLSQKREVWSNQVGMFDLSDERLRYYEMKVQRGLKKTTIIAEHESLEDGFNLDVLESPSGAKLADKIICSFAEKLISRKLYSSIFLTGKGFESNEWAEDFMKLICNRRRVYADLSIFSKGAAYKAADFLREKSIYPYVFICEGRLMATVSIPVKHMEKDSQLVVAAIGESWYESKSTMDFIIDGNPELELLITPPDVKKRKIIRISLDDFPKRPNRTTRIRVNMGFTDEKTMLIIIKDKGFGEIYPESDSVIRQEVSLWA